MSGQRPNINPPDGLTLPANKDSGKQSKFALFTDDWIKLQGYIGAGLELPLAQGDFETKYGSFGPSKTITDCIAAMRNVREASMEFGNPQTLRQAVATNPRILTTTEPPREIYTHTIWMGARVVGAAGRLASGYQSCLNRLTGLPAQEQVDNLKAFLFQPVRGAIPLSDQISKEVEALMRKLSAFETKMNQYNEVIKKYTADSSDMVQQVSQTVGELEQKIKDLGQSRDAAEKAWRDFTIAAITCSVGCALIGAFLAPFTFGISALVGGAAAIATAVGLGIKAEENRRAYNQYVEDIKTAGADLKKKQTLRSDLLDFNQQTPQVAPAMASFLRSLQGVQGVWLRLNTDLVGIANDITKDNVGTMPFLVQEACDDAVSRWKGIGESAGQFVEDSTIDYTLVRFGQDSMPEKKAA